MSFSSHLFYPYPLPTLSKHSSTITNSHLPTIANQVFTPKLTLINNILSFSLAITLTSPLPCTAIPSLNLPPTLQTTPFAQSKNLPIGLENGKIRACPSINPGCVTTNPQSSSFAFPWVIPENSTGNAVQKLREAILETQKNAKIQAIEDIPDGQYLQAEVDGGFGRDVLEFVVKRRRGCLQMYGYKGDVYIPLHHGFRRFKRTRRENEQDHGVFGLVSS